jgi:thioredoxin 1
LFDKKVVVFGFVEEKNYICAENQIDTLLFMESFNDIVNSDQLTLVDFFATWCGPCKMMHPVLVQLKDELGDSIRIIKIDVDKNESLSMNYRIQSVPTLMLFRKGEVLWRQSGALSVNDLKSIIASWL